MSMNRRELIKHFTTLLGATQLTPFMLAAQKALAETASDPRARFVLIRVDGAMDSTLGLHPVLSDVRNIDEKDLFLGYDARTEAFANVGGTQISLGPSAQPLLPYANQMAIVRGIFVGPNDLGHPFAIQHMTAGRAQESAPYWSAYIGRQFSATGNYLITNGVVQRGTVSAFPTLLTSVLRTQMAGASSQPSLLDLYKSKSLGVNSYLEFLMQKEQIKVFNEVIQESQKDGAELMDEDLIFASLYAGLGRVAQWDMDRETGKSMDTHLNHAVDHKPRQKARWDRIAKFLGRLQSQNMLNDTLVVVITEFNRTPGLNDNGGKDHNYSDNAVALFGRGVQGGQVVGDRSLFKREDGFPYAYWAGKHIDWESGEAVKVKRGGTPPKGADLIRPEDLWRSIAASLDPKLVKEAADGSKLLPKVFKRA